MTVQAAPRGDRLERPLEPTAGRLPLHHPETLLRPAPEVRETEEVKRPRRYSRQTRRCRPAGGPSKRYQPRFVWVDRQTVLAEPLRQHGQHAAGVLLTGEAHDQIIRVAHQEGTTVEARLHHL